MTIEQKIERLKELWAKKKEIEAEEQRLLENLKTFKAVLNEALREGGEPEGTVR